MFDEDKPLRTPALLEMINPTTRDLVTLENIRKVLEEDRKHMTRHPVLKHLFQRYDAIINQVTQFGNPRSPIEPVTEFRDRVNEEIVTQHNKRIVLERKKANRLRKQAFIKTNKTTGSNYYGRTNEGNYER